MCNNMYIFFKHFKNASCPAKLIHPQIYNIKLSVSS